MIARPLRRVALVLTVAAGAMALSSCASTLNDAATMTYTDQTGKHTAHISRADLVSDPWFAALAIESGCEWIPLDRDCARFPRLRWRTPF